MKTLTDFKKEIKAAKTKDELREISYQALLQDDHKECKIFLEKYAKLQSDDELPLRRCPRCGRATMKKPVHTNAFSRHADIYICDQCGTEEAVMDMKHIELPLEDWYLTRQLLA